MVDYSNAKKLIIENVDHPIHILGVEAPALMGCFWVFMGTLVYNPIIAPFMALIFGLIARQFFIYDQKGFPLTYSRSFLKGYQRFNWLKYIFPSLIPITLDRGDYRE